MLEKQSGISILFLIGTLALATRPALAGPNANESARWRAGMQRVEREVAAALERALRTVGTNKKQRSQIRVILGGHAVGAYALAGEAYRLQHRIAEAVLSEEIDDAQLDRLEKEGVSLVTRGAAVARVGIVDTARVLTPEQRAQLLRMWKRWWR